MLRQADPELLTAEAVADILNVSIRTIWRMIERGQLPEPVRFNRKLVRWRRADVTAWVAGLSQVRSPCAG